MMSCSEPGVYAISMLYKGECLLIIIIMYMRGGGGTLRQHPICQFVSNKRSIVFKSTYAPKYCHCDCTSQRATQ